MAIAQLLLMPGRATCQNLLYAYGHGQIEAVGGLPEDNTWLRSNSRPVLSKNGRAVGAEWHWRL